MRRDRLSGLILLLFGILILAEGLRLPYTFQGVPGPGFFPRWIGILVISLSVLLCLTTRAPNRPVYDNPTAWRRVTLVTLSLTIYTLVLDLLGFLLAAFLYFIFLVKGVEARSWQVALIGGLVVAVGCFLVFRVWLGVSLPKGIPGV